MSGHALVLFPALLLTAVLSGGCDRAEPPARQPAGAPIRSADQLLAAYLESTDADERRRLLDDLPDVAPDEGVAALGRLLEAESVPALQVELLRSLAVYEGQVVRKLAVLDRMLMRGPADPTVRNAALHALRDVRDPRAIPIWERLLDAPDEDARALARSAMDTLGAPES